MKTAFFITLALVIFIVLPLKSLFSTKERAGVIFSAIEGQLFQNGKALANVRLDRSWIFAEDNLEGKDFVITDALGRFSFPKIEHSYQRSQIFAQETIIEQSIRLKSADLQATDESLVIWLGSKRSFADGDETYDYSLGEFQGASPIKMIFDIGAPYKKIGSVLVRPFTEGQTP